MASVPYLFANVSSATGAQLDANFAAVPQIGIVAGMVINIAALQALSITNLTNGQIYLTAGYYTAGDYGGAMYQWNSTSTATADGGSVIQITANGTNPGRMLLIVSGPVNCRVFGSRGDGISNDQPPLQKWVNFVSSISGRGYLAPGTYLLSSAVDSYTLIQALSNIYIEGAGWNSVLKVANNVNSATQGSGIFYNVGNVSNCTLRNFTIDWNGANNLMPVGYTSTQHWTALGVGGSSSSNIKADNINFTNCPGPQCVYYQNGSSNCWVTNSYFYNVADSITGNNITDHSSIYNGAVNGVVDNCVFVNPNISNVATACEWHGTNSVIRGLTVSQYAKVSNIAAQVADNRGSIMSDVTASGVANGIMFGTAGAYLLAHLQLNNIKMGLREPSSGYPGAQGIYAPPSQMLSSTKANYIQINDVEIYQETFVTLSNVNEAINLVECDNVTINNPNIHDLTAEAIYVASGTHGIANLKISGGTLQNCGIGTTTANKRAIAINSTTTPGNEVLGTEIDGTRIICGAGSGTAATYGIQMNSGTFGLTKIRANISGAATQSLITGTLTSTTLMLDCTGPDNPFNLIAASTGSVWYDTTNGVRWTADYAAYSGTSSVWIARFGATASPTAGPVSGSWPRGSIAENMTPSASGPPRWKCTATGTPGTWAAEANIV